MAVDNFIPQLWSASIFVANRKAQVIVPRCNRNYEGEIRDQGQSVKINQIGAITISDYTKNSSTLTYAQLESASKLLVIDQGKSFSVAVEDIDLVQSNVDLMTAAADEAAYRLADAADQYVAGLYGDAGVTSGLGTTASPISITSSNILTYMATVAKALDDASCPSEGRWMVIPPWMHLKIRLAKITNENTTNKALEEGAADKILGFNIYVSNNIAVVGSTKYKILAGTNRAITYADQLVKMEAIRLESRFCDGLRGLHVYGAKVVRPEDLAVLTATEGAES